MPLEYKIEKNRRLISIWELTENENELLNIVTNLQIPFSHLLYNVNFEQKRKERLAALICVNNVLGKNAHYIIGENGKPFIPSSNNHISISNSAGKVAVIISDDNCGIDFQYKTEQLVRILSKFANADEQKMISLFKEPIDLIHWIWSAKEAIYKKHNKKGLSLKNDIILKDVENLNNETKLYFEVCIEGKKTTEEIGCTLLQDFYMAYTCY